MKAWPILGILIVQTILFLAHWLLYGTWIAFGWPLGPHGRSLLGAALLALSLLFIAATLLGFRLSIAPVRLLYRAAVLWLGLLNFLFFGAIALWIVDSILRLALPGAVHLAARPWLAGAVAAASLAACIYGLVNARILRLRRLTVTLENLPEQWRGRTALLFSDVHLGHINRARFARRIQRLAQQLRPDIAFLPGDLFDGVRVDPAEIAAPLFEIDPPFGKYFVAGNHEELGDAKTYCDGIRRGGWRVLENELEDVDGLRIVGVPYHVSTHPMALRQFLQGLRLEGGPATILLQHVPNRLPIVEQAGVSLMLCGHTHSGQIFPFTWITRRAFGPFTYGLQRFGALQVLTSSGIGTWGPPMRIGTAPEAVLITFA